jgi:hypothetical protein
VKPDEARRNRSRLNMTSPRCLAAVRMCWSGGPNGRRDSQVAKRRIRSLPVARRSTAPARHRAQAEKADRRTVEKGSPRGSAPDRARGGARRLRLRSSKDPNAKRRMGRSSGFRIGLLTAPSRPATSRPVSRSHRTVVTLQRSSPVTAAGPQRNCTVFPILRPRRRVRGDTHVGGHPNTGGALVNDEIGSLLAEFSARLRTLIRLLQTEEGRVRARRIFIFFLADGSKDSKTALTPALSHRNGRGGKREIGPRGVVGR